MEILQASCSWPGLHGMSGVGREASYIRGISVAKRKRVNLDVKVFIHAHMFVISVCHVESPNRFN